MSRATGRSIGGGTGGGPPPLGPAATAAAARAACASAAAFAAAMSTGHGCAPNVIFAVLHLGHVQAMTPPLSVVRFEPSCVTAHLSTSPNSGRVTGSALQVILSAAAKASGGRGYPRVIGRSAHSMPPNPWAGFGGTPDLTAKMFWRRGAFTRETARPQARDPLPPVSRPSHYALTSRPANESPAPRTATG